VSSQGAGQLGTMPRSLDVTLSPHFERQRGLTYRRQVLALGGTPRQIHRRLPSGEWDSAFLGVYRLCSAPPSWEQDLLAACMTGGYRGVVSHRSAAHLHRLSSGATIVEITTPRWRRARRCDVIAHETRRLETRFATMIDGLPVTSLARTLCDLAAVVDRAALDRDLDEALMRDSFDIAAVWRCWEQLGGVLRPGGHRLEAALNAWKAPLGKPESSAELQLLQRLRTLRLPEPVPQFWVRLPDGSRVRLDFAWPRCKVGAEFDSYKWHGGRERYEQTLQRRLALRALGWDVIAVTDAELDAGLPVAGPALFSLLRERGCRDVAS
jgi:hypothetical protein